ncbi:MAG TPA: PIG-L deacetylase family protein [Limnochordia bacterium]|nr:PIG-L deacetylase family protein [Limnochordia bacterium]
MTLQLRQRFMAGLYTAAFSWPGRLAMRRAFRAALPPLARLAGEELVGVPRRVLAITAHPDDLEFFAGGTLRRMALAGGEIHALVLTDGEKHGNYLQTGALRRTEQRLAARRQGFASVRFCGLPDFALAEDPRVEGIVDRAWGELEPEVVFAFDPQELVARMANRDHKALGRTVMDVTRRRLGSGARVYFYGTRQANVVVDIEAVLEAKWQAIESHASQLIYLTRPAYQEGFRLIAQAFATGSGCRYAEGLYRLV